MPIKIGSGTFNNGGTAKYNTTALNSIKYGITEVWKKMTYFFDGGPISGYSWSTGYNAYANMSASGTTIYSNSNSKVGSIAEGTLRCPFNASNFSTIYVNVTTCSTSKSASSDNTSCYVYIGTAAQSTQNLLASSSYTRGGKCTSTGLKSFDVSGLSGTYYVVIGGAMSTGNSYNIVVNQVYGV